MNIELSEQQKRAVDGFNDWFKTSPSNRYPHYYIGGYAGTGKSTLSKFILEQFPNDERHRIIFLAPTGKAADVLRKKGVNAMTIHSAIYKPMGSDHRKINELRHRLDNKDYSNDRERVAMENQLGLLLATDPSFSLSGQSDLDQPLLYVVDEFSMVGDRLYEDLITAGVPILAFGDPGQLPPVKDSKPLFDPDVTLTEIHRQSLDNPIIKLASTVRTGGQLELGKYGDSAVIGPDDYTSDVLLSHDQIICFSNNTRKLVNKRVRELKGHKSVYPETGEKVVCKQNNYERDIFNGSMYETVECKKYSSGILLTVSSPTQYVRDLPTYALTFDEYVRNVHPRERMSKEEQRDINVFDFGYCITGHASQGSEWDSVLVIDETPKMRSHQKEWLYTAITRAAKRVTVYQR